MPPSTSFSGTFFAISLKSLHPDFSSKTFEMDMVIARGARLRPPAWSDSPIGLKRHRSGRANVQLGSSHHRSGLPSNRSPRARPARPRRRSHHLHSRHLDPAIELSSLGRMSVVASRSCRWWLHSGYTFRPVLMVPTDINRYHRPYAEMHITRFSSVFYRLSR